MYTYTYVGIEANKTKHATATLTIVILFVVVHECRERPFIKMPSVINIMAAQTAIIVVYSIFVDVKYRKYQNGDKSMILIRS